MALTLAQFEAVLDFRMSLMDETDRGAALMAAAYLDDELLTLVGTHLVSTGKVFENLSRQDGPLGSFSSRIDLAFAMGLIGPKAQRDLNLIRKIRNDFGHTSTPLGFNAPGIAARVKALHYNFLDKRGSARALFIRACVALLAVIHSTTLNTRSVKAATDREPTPALLKRYAELEKQEASELLRDIITNSSPAKTRPERS